MRRVLGAATGETRRVRGGRTSAPIAPCGSFGGFSSSTPATSPAESRFWAGLLGGSVREDGDEMFTVYASPAGHPFCFGVH